MVLIVKELRVGLSLSKHYVIGVTTSSDGIVQHKTGNFSKLAYDDDGVYM